MIIIGSPLVAYQKHHCIRCKEDILDTPPNSILHLQEFDGALMAYMQQNELAYSVMITHTYELVLANALGATYIITDDPKDHQEIATNYLFDSKLLTFIQDIKQIDTLATTNIDGVIFKEAIV
ncbi:MAG: hypothetical protein ACQESH_08730 [Campylobacterota bacterium]